MRYAKAVLKAVGSLLFALFSVCIISVLAALFMAAFIPIASLLLAVRAWEKVFQIRSPDAPVLEALKRIKREERDRAGRERRAAAQ